MGNAMMHVCILGNIWKGNACVNMWKNVVESAIGFRFVMQV